MTESAWLDKAMELADGVAQMYGETWGHGGEGPIDRIRNEAREALRAYLLLRPVPAGDVAAPVMWTNQKELERAKKLPAGYACATWGTEQEFADIPLYATPPDREALRYRWLKARNPQALAAIAWGESSAACKFSEPDAAIDTAINALEKT